MIDQNKVDEIFYYYAKQYYEHNGDLNVPKEFITNDGYTFNPNGIINLGNWIKLKKEKLNVENEIDEKIKEILLSHEINEKEKIDRTWLEYYNFAKKYYEHNDNLNVPYPFKTNDGYTYDKDGTIELGKWITLQRSKENIKTEKGKLLLKIGMDFENQNEKKWSRSYKIAENYYKHYGNLNVPNKFKTSDGINKDDEGILDLSDWVKKQRHIESPESERGKLLLKIGMDFENQKDKAWEKNYKLAENYYKQFGNLDVPSEFITNDGINKDSKGILDLSLWIKRQKQKVNPTSEKGKMLLKIGIDFEEKNTKFLPWEIMYKFAENYFKYYGNLNVPNGFKTNDGYTYDENGKIELDKWLNEQKKNETLTSEKGKLLLKIGFKFKKIDERWFENYKIAKKYYEHNGNLKVPNKFKTNDGYTYDENGKIKLGGWISLQRRGNLEPGDGKWELLTQIGMVWNVNSRNSEIKEMCLCNNINYDINKNILKKIAIQELYSKIEFLKQNEKQIVTERGILIDIFSMSSQNIKLKYGLSLEEIVNEYYINNIKGKEI